MGNTHSAKAEITKKCNEDKATWSRRQRKAIILKLVKLYEKIFAETGNHDKTLEVIKAEYVKIKKTALQNQSLLAQLNPKTISPLEEEMIDGIMRYNVYRTVDSLSLYRVTTLLFIH